MAIAFVAKGTTLKVDTSATAGPYSVALPAGHVSGHLLLMFVTTDDNTNTTADPSGWTRLFYITNGSSVQTPYTPRVRTKCYYRIDNGSLGSSVTLNFDTTDSWPTGKPSVLAFCVAYSGCDQTGPIERWDFVSTTSTAAAEAHPQETTSTANAWLLSFRAVSTDSPGATFTCSVGTDAERQDDFDTIPELASALYDSNAALTAGLQTQRTTTASRLATYGGLAASIVIKPASAANAVYANAGTAAVSLTAPRPSVATTVSPWDLCAPGGLPTYSFLIDWNNDGLTLDGTVLNANPYVRTDTSDWTPANATVARSIAPINGRVPVLQLTSGTGSQPRADTGQSAVVAGQTYRAYGWAMAPAALPSTASLSLNWYDNTHAYLSTSADSLTLVSGQWTLFDQTFVAPGGAAYSSLPFSIDGTPGAGYVLYGYGLMLLDPGQHYPTLAPGPGEDALSDAITDITITYGRDQERQLNPAAVGSAAFSLINVARQYSPEWTGSVLYGDLEPARSMLGQVSWAGGTIPLFRGRIDDYTIKADKGDRSVDFTFLDALNDLSQVNLSTPVYMGLRTGDLMNVILDAVGWTAGRDIDPGATLVEYWWAEGQGAFDAVNDLVKSEGAPAIAFVAPDGTFVFHDRHHRILNATSTTSQGTYAEPRMFDCAAPPVTGFGFTEPFTYAHGWREIVNSVSFDVSERQQDTDLSVIWSTTDVLTLSIGQSLDLDMSGSEPFLGALTPVAGTDYVTTGAGVLQTTLSRTSGASAKLTLLAVGGPVTVQGIQVRGYAIPVKRTLKISRKDSGSISLHGERSYPNAAPWAGVNDAYDIAGSILVQYAQRRPTVELRIVTKDPSHFVQILNRTIGDRIHIINGEMGLDSDFFIERVTHTIQRVNQVGRPPVHSVVFGCEKVPTPQANPFRFDVRGAGFDQGTFDPIQTDSPYTVFVFDDPVLGVFDFGQYGT